MGEWLLVKTVCCLPSGHFGSSTRVETDYFPLLRKGGNNCLTVKATGSGNDWLSVKNILGIPLAGVPLVILTLERQP
jgi:hypothetical protein